MDDDADESDYSGFDTSDPDDDATAPCPACGAEIYDDAERCPECGHYLTREAAPRHDSVGGLRSKPPLWIIVGAILCIIIVVLWVVAGI
jgi:hypothetical protein